MNTRLPNRLCCTYLTTLLLALAPLAHAQTGTPDTPGASVADPAATSPNAAKDQPVTLSAFEVKEPDDRGYTAAESMTGARFATPIKDLPFEVNVVTSEFLKDFSVFEIDDTVAYVSSLAVQPARVQPNLPTARRVLPSRPL